MRPTLLVALSGSCEGSCEFCTLKSGEGPLDVALLASKWSLLGSVSPAECVVLCPDSTRHPGLVRVLRLMCETCTRTVLMTHVSGIRELNKAAIELVDEVVLVSAQPAELEQERERIKAVLSQGYDRVSVWLVVTGSSSDVAKVYRAQAFCKSLGLSLRIGEPPYSSAVNVDPVSMLSRVRRVEVGLHCGRVYGYSATSAFLGGYPALLLSKPLFTQCRSIFVSPSGAVSKCPVGGDSTPLVELDKRTLRRVLYSDCPACHPSVELMPVVSISLRDRRTGAEIPTEILMLLEVIDELRSFRAACEALGLSPSTYAEKIKNLEKKLQFKLLLTARGGSKRGATILTAHAKQILSFYKSVSEKISRLIYAEKCRVEI